MTRTGERRAADREYKIFIENHELLALKALLNKEELEELLSPEKIQQLNDLIEEIKKAELNEGIVDQIINEKPHFIHRTFAEYFASFYIAKNMLTSPAITLKLIDNVLLNASPIFINNIIEQLNGKQEIISKALNKPLLKFVNSIDHENFIKSLVRFGYSDWAKRLDCSAKTFLHYAFEDDHIDEVKKLLEYANDTYEKDILEHGRFKKPEYEHSKLVAFVNSKDKDNKTALEYVMQKNLDDKQTIDCAFELLLKGANMDLLSDEQVKILINYMLHKRGDDSGDDIENNIYNGGILAAYADEENMYRPIQEKLFLRMPSIFKEFGEWDKSIILSYFFVHGRLEVIRALLSTTDDIEQRKKILNNKDPMYRVIF